MNHESPMIYPLFGRPAQDILDAGEFFETLQGTELQLLGSVSQAMEVYKLVNHKS